MNRPQIGLSPASPIAITGYSGRAIASGWAAELAPSYAPGLNIVGVAFGGPPTDYAVLHRWLNGGLGSRLYLAASAGLAGEYPELLQFDNANGLRLAQIDKDQCAGFLAYSGILMLSAESLSNAPDSFDTLRSQRIIAETVWALLHPPCRYSFTKASRMFGSRRKARRTCGSSGAH